MGRSPPEPGRSALFVAARGDGLAAPDGPTVRIEAPEACGLSPARWDAALWSAARQLWPDWRPAPTPDSGRRLEDDGRRRLEAAARHEQASCPARPWPALAHALGAPELAVHVVTPGLDEASADATSRTLEAARDHLGGATLWWWVDPAALALPGVVRLLEAAGVEAAPPPGAPPRAHDERGARPARPDARPTARFDPIEGRPHPASPAELALFRALEASPDLQGAFRFNHWVETDEGGKLVDAVSARLGLAVEVDGYRYHGGRAPFARDRHRDFLLAARGWRTLRLTHDEVMADVAAALDKIRALARAPKEPQT